MLSLDLSGLAKFEADLAAALEKLDADISKKFDSFTREVFSSIVQHSPQYSGNLASNWNFSKATPDESYSQGYDKGKVTRRTGVFSQGDPAAVSRALARMQAIAPVSWKDKVFITNATPAEEGAYLADLIEDGKVNLRPANLVDGRAAIFNYTVAIYTKEGREV